MAHIAVQQDLMHQIMHQIIAALNAVTFNISNEGPGIGRYEGRQACGHGCPLRGKRCGPPMYAIGRSGYNPVSGYPHVGGFPPTRPPSFFQPGPQLSFPGGPTGGHIVPPVAMTQPAYRAPPAASPSGFNITGTVNANIQQMPYSNITKRYPNWNACYTCGFDISNGHTSMTCPAHCKPTHDVNFNCRNAQQPIDLGHPCCTRHRHNTRLPSAM
jgi:hypothetical protein